MQIPNLPPPIPTGQIKSLGPYGPEYEVGHMSRRLEDGDWLVEITLIRTSERAEYRLSNIFKDPEAH